MFGMTGVGNLQMSAPSSTPKSCSCVRVCRQGGDGYKDGLEEEPRLDAVSNPHTDRVCSVIGPGSMTRRLSESRRTESRLQRQGGQH